MAKKLPPKEIKKENIVRNPADTEQKYSLSKQSLEQWFAEYHKILLDKVLSANKSLAMKNQEQHVVAELTKAAVALDQLNIGEGLTAMAVIAIREHLIVRDRVNELEYEIEKLKRELAQVKSAKK